MSCCPSNIIPFNNVATTEIFYTEALRAQFGRVPKVEVIYADNGEYYIAGQPGVKLSGVPVNLITVDHGGPAVGIIKLG